ncbi:nitric oxide synthase oxygenase [Paenibacillus roseipurpureus]|uniref:Nitric oxide synthase oxygenase n=1 Tax=Paenibacillus roseopurpureus TaxID=2918901 RepID=A0AA96LSQ9_9BACL|nr:nitric oxide synthase oxygenase [Paenibacillus sp. MBLB1832]WNR44035.1 nitric oxide synthase oxygenase [Paenibacillus sp. MBLB1832]
MKVQDPQLDQAIPFIQECYTELGKSQSQIDARIVEIGHAIRHHGEYVHTLEELEHGAKMAWRNSNRCIGRLFWESLRIHDARHVETEDEMAEALLRHIEVATNGGKIRPVITVFPPAREGKPRVQIKNEQLIRYAGYETEDGIIGDPISLAFTRECQAMGWQGAGTPFDVLPLLIQVGERAPKLYEIPKELVLEVPIRHPELPAFEQLGLQWYAVPMVANMYLNIGGVIYPAAPFNGWYMGTEIGARNFADEARYNMLPQVAAIMGLDTSRESTLWRDKALVELNVAVLSSFQQHGVTIVDHHTAAKQFKRFEDKEAKSGRDVTGDWTWLIPPMSPAATHIFHSHYTNEVKLPNFFYRNKKR